MVRFPSSTLCSRVPHWLPRWFISEELRCPLWYGKDINNNTRNFVTSDELQSDAALESTVSNALLIDVTIDSPIAIQMRDVCVQVTVLYARVVFRDSPEILKKLGKEMKNDPEERNLGTRFDMTWSNLKSSRTRNSGIQFQFVGMSGFDSS